MTAKSRLFSVNTNNYLEKNRNNGKKLSHPDGTENKLFGITNRFCVIIEKITIARDSNRRGRTVAKKVKLEFARTGIIAFIIVGLLGMFVPSDKRLIVFGPVALTLLLGLMLGKYRRMPFGINRDNQSQDQQATDRPDHTDDFPPAQA